MGLPSYIINFEELKPIIKEAVESANIKAELGNVTLDTASLKIDLTPIINDINTIVTENQKQTTSLTSGMTNLQTIADLLTKIKDEHGANLQTMVDRINSLITLTTTSNDLLKSIGETLGAYNGSQKIVGKKINVLSGTTSTDYTLIQHFPKNSVLTAVTIASTSYTAVDCWSLYLGQIAMSEIFDSVYVKPFGDRKEFKKTLAIPAGEDLVLKFTNISNSGKTIFVDFEYIELNP